ncbi:MAG: ferredoxin-type protein NapG [Gammaproteobacteria bacterium]|nr:ferredoxin-type protein NapG [Gammaproteobacteria bacterium]
MVTTKSQTLANRRRFFRDVAKGIGGAVLVGFGLSLYARHAKSLPTYAVRPPGALDEELFASACIRCGLCVRDCPYEDVLRLAPLEDEVTAGTPYFVAREAGCEMCEDIPCVKACPTGALDKSLTEIESAKMGLAVLVDQETCLNFQGLRCDVCYRVCPVIDKAITLEIHHNKRTGHHAFFIPTVHSDACTGCGKCEETCVLEEAAIKVFPLHLAKGKSGKHYQMDWNKKQKTGLTVTPAMQENLN